MAPHNSGFRSSRPWRAILAGSVGVLVAVSLSRLGYSQAAQVPPPAKKAAVSATAGETSTATAPAVTVDYARDIHPILADHCLVCHNAEKRSGGLSLGTYDDIMQGGKDGAAVSPGHSGQSLLVRRIVGEVGPVMPLGGDPLSAAEIATLRKWIDEGARATPGSDVGKARWEPQLTLTEPAMPAVTWSDWTQPLDRFTAAYLAKQGVAQPIPVDQAEFARRAFLDIQGFLPTPDEIRAFLASKDPEKRTKLVASLMDNPTRYSEHWISYWNDLLRNDEGVVYYSETAGRKSITPWLLDALVKNKPYNQMVKELLNPTMPTDPDGFLIGVNWRGTTSASQTPALQASQNTAQIFIGINFKCNSCHDSFISKWKLKDAYSLAAYFSAEEKLQLYRCDVAQPDQFATASYMYPEINRPLASLSTADRRSTIAEIFTDPRNGRLPRTLVNRIWERLMGRGIVENVDDMDGEPWSPEVLDYLSSDFVKSGYDIKHLIATIIGSQTYQMQAVARPEGPPKNYVFRGPELRRITAEQFADAIASVTGDWHVAKAPTVSATGATGATGAPKVLGVFSGAPVDTEENLAINARLAAPRPAATGSTGSTGSTGVSGSTGSTGVTGTTGTAAAGATGRTTQIAGGRGGANGATGSTGASGATGRGPAPIAGGIYAREWRVAGSNLTRAMGRPIRDQVYSTRDTQATTMQAVELVNGETLNHWVWRGAQRMLGELPPEPTSLFSRQVAGTVTTAPAPAATGSTGGVGRGGATAATSPPVVDPADAAYPPLMVTINGSNGPLLKAVQAKDVAKAATEAAKMATAFDSVVKYWSAKKADDAASLAMKAWDAANTIANSKDVNVQDEALTTLLNTCSQCHTAHRISGAQGVAAISTSVLATGVSRTVVVPPVPFSIDVSKSKKLYLIVEDGLSTAPDKATPLWLNAVFTAGDGSKTPLTSLRPVDVSGLRDDKSPIIPLGGDKDKPVIEAVRVKFPSVLVYDISNRGFKKFEGIPTFENVTLAQGETTTGRFFIFDQPPGMDRLAPPKPETPLPALPPVKTVTEAVDRVYWHLLGRAPTAAERLVATEALRDPAHPNRPTAAALADLLWSVMVSPEFQFIR